MTVLWWPSTGCTPVTACTPTKAPPPTTACLIAAIKPLRDSSPSFPDTMTLLSQSSSSFTALYYLSTGPIRHGRLASLVQTSQMIDILERLQF